MSSLSLRALAVLLASITASPSVAAQARVKSPIAGAQQVVAMAPLIVRLERREAATEVRVERAVIGNAPPAICDFRRGNVPPVGGIRIMCGDVGPGWPLRVQLRKGASVIPCTGNVSVPAVQPGVPVVLAVTHEQDRPAAMEFYSCRFDP